MSSLSRHPPGAGAYTSHAASPTTGGIGPLVNLCGCWTDYQVVQGLERVREGVMEAAERDDVLVVRCQLGERAAFRELVDRWHDPLWRYLRGMVDALDVADDLAQEVWVAVVRGLPRLREPHRFTAWLFTVARRTVMNHLRVAYRSPQLSELHAPVQMDLAATEDLDAVLTTMDIEAGLHVLPPMEREVLILFHVDDLPLSTCAEVLGVPAGTVKSRLHRARRMLRDALLEKGYEP